MKTKNITGSHKQSSRDIKARYSTFRGGFCREFSMQCAWGQGFKMTQLEVPGNVANGTVPIAVNTSEAVVGIITASSGRSGRDSCIPVENTP